MSAASDGNAHALRDETSGHEVHRSDVNADHSSLQPNLARNVRVPECETTVNMSGIDDLILDETIENFEIDDTGEDEKFVNRIPRFPNRQTEKTNLSVRDSILSYECKSSQYFSPLAASASHTASPHHGFANRRTSCPTIFNPQMDSSTPRRSAACEPVAPSSASNRRINFSRSILKSSDSTISHKTKQGNNSFEDSGLSRTDRNEFVSSTTKRKISKQNIKDKNDASDDSDGENEPAGDNIEFMTSQDLITWRHRLKQRKKKAASVKWWIILPESRPQQVWSIVVLVLLVYTTIMMPLRVAFASDDSPYIIDLVVEMLFIVDIGLSFITAYENQHGRLETNPKRIIINYSCSWLLVDIISVFPFFLFPESSTGILFSALRLPRLLKLLKLTRLLKLMRLYRLRSLIVAVEYSPFVHQKFLRVTELLCIMFAFSHFSACVWYFLGDLYLQDGISSDSSGVPWLLRLNNIDDLTTQSNTYKYAISLYWALTTLTTVGYGDIVAETTAELVFSMISMVVGTTIFAYVTATVASMISERDQRAKMLRAKMTQLRTFASHFSLSARLRHQITKRMAVIWGQHAHQDGSMAELMPEFPADLAVRVTTEIHHDLRTKSNFGRKFVDKQDFLLSLLQQLLPLKLASGETLAHEGDLINHWFILDQGEIRSVHSIHPLLVQYEAFSVHDTFGDYYFTKTNSSQSEHTANTCMNGKWPVTLRCTSNCRLWVMSIDVLSRIVAHFGMYERFAMRGQTQLNRLGKAREAKVKALRMLEAHSRVTDHAITMPINYAARTSPTLTLPFQHSDMNDTTSAMVMNTSQTQKTSTMNDDEKQQQRSPQLPPSAMCDTTFAPISSHTSNVNERMHYLRHQEILTQLSNLQQQIHLLHQKMNSIQKTRRKRKSRIVYDDDETSNDDDDDDVNDGIRIQRDVSPMIAQRETLRSGVIESKLQHSVKRKRVTGSNRRQSLPLMQQHTSSRQTKRVRAMKVTSMSSNNNNANIPPGRHATDDDDDGNHVFV